MLLNKGVRTISHLHLVHVGMYFMLLLMRYFVAHIF